MKMNWISSLKVSMFRFVKHFSSLKLVVPVTVALLLSACVKETYTSQATQTHRYGESIYTAAALSSDGKLSLLADGREVCLWNNSTKQKVFDCIKGEGAEHIELAGISDNKRFFYLSNRLTIQLYDLGSGRLISQWSTPGSQVISSLAISTNGTLLVSGLRTGEVDVINIQQKTRAKYAIHRLDVNSVAISANETQVISGSSDKKASIWSIQTGEVMHSLKHRSRVNYVAMEVTAKTAFAVDAIDNQQFIDVANGEFNAELDTIVRYLEVNDSAFSKDGQLFVTASPKQKIQLWQVRNGNQLAKWQAQSVGRQRTSVLSVSFINSNQIATLTSDGVYQEWPLPKDS